jgi:YD repeat-containing protein
VTDGEGRITTMSYDALNRMISSIDPANATTTYAY